MSKATWININGTWKKCKAVWLNVNGTWKKIIDKVNINGVWKDAITYNFWISSYADKIYFYDLDGKLLSTFNATNESNPKIFTIKNSFLREEGGYMYKYDLQGNKVQSQLLSLEIKNLVNNDNYFYIVSSGNNIIKIDSSNLNRIKSIDNLSGEISLNFQNNFLYVGTNNYTYAHNYFQKYDSDLNLIWKTSDFARSDYVFEKIYQYNNFAYGVTTSWNGVGALQIYKYNNDTGGYIEKFTIDYSSSGNILRSIKDERYIYVFHTRQDYSYNIYVSKFDMATNTFVISGKNIDTIPREKGRYITPEYTDGQYIYCTDLYDLIILDVNFNLILKITSVSNSRSGIYNF